MPLTYFLKDNNSNRENSVDFSYLANGDIAHIYEISYWLSNGVFTFDLSPFLRSKSRSCKFRLWLSRKRWQTEQILLYPVHMKSPTGIWLVYLYLTLAHSNGQSQGHLHFNCEYLMLTSNGQKKYCYCEYIRSCLLAFDWCIYIWTWIISPSLVAFIINWISYCSPGSQ